MLPLSHYPRDFLIVTALIAFGGVLPYAASQIFPAFEVRAASWIEILIGLLVSLALLRRWNPVRVLVTLYFYFCLVLLAVVVIVCLDGAARLSFSEMTYYEIMISRPNLLLIWSILSAPLLAWMIYVLQRPDVRELFEDRDARSTPAPDSLAYAIKLERSGSPAASSHDSCVSPAQSMPISRYPLDFLVVTTLVMTLGGPLLIMNALASFQSGSASILVLLLALIPFILGWGLLRLSGLCLIWTQFLLSIIALVLLLYLFKVPFVFLEDASLLWHPTVMMPYLATYGLLLLLVWMIFVLNRRSVRALFESAYVRKSAPDYPEGGGAKANRQVGESSLK